MKLKNKKRVGALLVAMMMVFAVGTAFAFQAGVLGMAGTVIVQPEVRLDFASVSISQAIDDAVGNVPLSSGAITPTAVAGRDNQQITFASVFRENGQYAEIEFSITNPAAASAETGPAWIGDIVAQLEANAAISGGAFTVTGTYAGATATSPIAGTVPGPAGTIGPFTVRVTLADISAVTLTGGAVTQAFTFNLPYGAIGTTW